MKKQFVHLSPYSVVYAAIVLLFVLYTFFTTDIRNFFHGWQTEHAISLSDGWQTADGNVIDITRISFSGKDGTVIVTHTLPEDVRPGESFNFNSHNIYFQLRIGKGMPYRFYPEKNFTGSGYGDAVHTIALTGDMAGETIEIIAQPVFEGESSSGFENLMVCTYNVYCYKFFAAHWLSFLLSLLIIFFGIVVFIVHFGIMRRHNPGNYNLIALGLTTILLGFWTLLETNVLQLVTGSVVYLRVLDYLLQFFMGYPLVVFINSLMKKSRKIYNQIAFCIFFVEITLACLLRFVAGIDMHRMGLLTQSSFLATFILMVVMFVRDRRYCKRKGIENELGYFYAGAAAFIAGSVLNILLYNLSSKMAMDNGLFMRLGLIFFIVMMFFQIMHWISAEQRISRHDRFINQLLQYSMSGESPEEIIHQMLEYLGTEMKADRAYIFEDRWDGTFDNSYEWCKAGVSAQIDNLQKVPFDGLLDIWYHEFEKSNHVLIYDIEEYKTVSEPMYALLKPQGIETLVTGPLEVSGKYVGFFGVDNPPEEMMEEVSEIIRILAYFITAVIKQRNEQQQLLNYSYSDQMTGTRNRRALEEFLEHGLDKGTSYGYLMCDINGLKAANDNLGHEAGDSMICDVADVLIMIFGKKNVYRLGGDEFCAFGLKDGEEAFTDMVEDVKKLLKVRGRSASLGYVFCREGKQDFDEVKNEADTRMYADKAAYYAANPKLERRT